VRVWGTSWILFMRHSLVKMWLPKSIQNETQPELNFINVLLTAFTPADPESIKRY